MESKSSAQSVALLIMIREARRHSHIRKNESEKHPLSISPHEGQFRRAEIAADRLGSMDERPVNAHELTRGPL